MSALGSSLIEQSGFTGMLLPQLKGFLFGETMRTLNSVRSVLARTRVCQILPAAERTSSMPYSAEPAVCWTATIRTSVGGFCLFICVPAWGCGRGRGTSGQEKPRRWIPACAGMTNLMYRSVHPARVLLNSGTKALFLSNIHLRKWLETFHYVLKPLLNCYLVEAALLNQPTRDSRVRGNDGDR